MRHTMNASIGRWRNFSGIALNKFRIGIVPPRFEFLERIVFAGRHRPLLVDMWIEWRFRAELARGFDEVQRADGIDIEIIKGNTGREGRERAGRRCELLLKV